MTNALQYEMRTCEVCGREYKAYLVYDDRPSYYGACSHCGSCDEEDLDVGHEDKSGLGNMSAYWRQIYAERALSSWRALRLSKDEQD